MILYPFANILLWSLIFAMALGPLHKSMTAKLGSRPKLTSFIIVFFTLSIVFIPSWVMVDSLVVELQQLKESIDINGFSVAPPPEYIKDWPLIGDRLFDLWYNASTNMEETILKYKDQLTNIGGELAKGILGSLTATIQIMISFIIAAILLAFGGVGESLRKFFTKLMGTRGDEFADVTINTVNSVVKGVIGVAFIVAFLQGMIFMLAGIPYAGILALLVFVLGVLQVPVFIVVLPVIVYLFNVESTAIAVVWSILLVIAGLSDNILKPILLGKGSSVPMLVIFIGVLGGFILSGFIGLFTGAIVMSLGYMLFIEWLNTDNELN